MRLKPTLAWSAITILDLGVALGLATLIRLHFLVSQAIMTNPPICTNHYGDSVACSLQGPGSLIYLCLLAGFFALLLVGELVVSKRRRPARRFTSA
jgi:hypothetical protein